MLVNKREQDRRHSFEFYIRNNREYRAAGRNSIKPLLGYFSYIETNGYMAHCEFAMPHEPSHFYE